MMKFGRKIFFTRGLYNSPGTFVGPSRELLDSFFRNIFHKFVTHSGHVLWHISRKNDEILLGNVFNMGDIQFAG